MANTAVWHAKYRIELDLTDPHLGHPDRPGLLGEVYPTPDRGLLQCPQCRDYGDPDCPEWMHLRRRDGRLHAVHYNTTIKDHGAGESDAHKALKERIATAGENGGLQADVESRAADGSRRTDVRITGGVRDLACEAQLSYASRQNVQKRSKKAWEHQLTPMWATTNLAAPYIGVAPWAGLQRMHWQQFLTSADLPVLGGARRFTRERCTKTAVCEDRKIGRKCTGWNVHWVARKVQTLDHLVVGAAIGDWVPWQSNIGNKATWFWVKTEDAAEADPAGGQAVPKTPDEASAAQAGEDLRALDRTCRYGQEREFQVKLPVDYNERITVIAQAPTTSADERPATATAAPAYGVQMIIPGTQTVDGADVAVATTNMQAFVDEVRARAEVEGQVRGYTASVGEPIRNEAADQEGRYGWVLPVNGRHQEILMPGVDPAQLRGSSTSAPCVKVNGNSWWWNDAAGSAIPLPELRAF
ncbi:hypothetical protein AB0M46_41175 [Dactylosporangium sp. NPDC051485]|uniref:competence protein CoiA family protein n=1 Tax=Dactylosporangium sp. NPDC051485 TaxID=3154846 RepID=UPI00344521FE